MLLSMDCILIGDRRRKQRQKIRFWHTSSGTLLSEYYTDGQITSLIWSRFRKEIVATFGFGGTSKSNLLCVYTYPQMQPILEVNAAQLENIKRYFTARLLFGVWPLMIPPLESISYGKGH